MHGEILPLQLERLRDRGEEHSGSPR